MSGEQLGGRGEPMSLCCPHLLKEGIHHLELRNPHLRGVVQPTSLGLGAAIRAVL